MGSMTRARAKAIQDKVNLFLNEVPFDVPENWLLPKAWTVNVLQNEGM